VLEHEDDALYSWHRDAQRKDRQDLQRGWERVQTEAAKKRKRARRVRYWVELSAAIVCLSAIVWLAYWFGIATMTCLEAL